MYTTGTEDGPAACTQESKTAQNILSVYCICDYTVVDANGRGLCLMFHLCCRLIAFVMTRIRLVVKATTH